ncbi:MAG: hypothetical protein AB8H79_11325 [Myxococcota bacterium]
MSMMWVLCLLSGCALAGPGGQPTPLVPAGLVTGPSLSDDFPLVILETRSSFAHDRGTIVRLNRVTVDGKEIVDGQVIAAIVASWHGYTPKGGRTDAEAVAMVDSFLKLWDRDFQVNRLTDTKAYSSFDGILERYPGVGPFHPPTVEMTIVGGEKVIVAKHFAYSYTGQRGNVFIHSVRAFRVSDGQAIELPSGPKTQALREY